MTDARGLRRSLHPLPGCDAHSRHRTWCRECRRIDNPTEGATESQWGREPVSIETIMDLADRSARFRSRGSDFAHFQELKQEGAIGGWLAVHAGCADHQMRKSWCPACRALPERSEAYVQRAIINRMVHFLGQGTIFGHHWAQDARPRPELEAELDEVTARRLYVVDAYPSLTDEVAEPRRVEELLAHLDPIKRELMHRKYVLGEEDPTIRGAMGLTQGQANTHHRWAVHALRNQLKEAA